MLWKHHVQHLRETLPDLVLSQGVGREQPHWQHRGTSTTIDSSTCCRCCRSCCGCCHIGRCWCWCCCCCRSLSSSCCCGRSSWCQRCYSACSWRCCCCQLCLHGHLLEVLPALAVLRSASVL